LQQSLVLLGGGLTFPPSAWPIRKSKRSPWQEHYSTFLADPPSERFLLCRASLHGKTGGRHRGSRFRIVIIVEDGL
jgi:hypothetical protein